LLTIVGAGKPVLPFRNLAIDFVRLLTYLVVSAAHVRATLHFLHIYFFTNAACFPAIICVHGYFAVTLLVTAAASLGALIPCAPIAEFAINNLQVFCSTFASLSNPQLRVDARLSASKRVLFDSTNALPLTVVTSTP